MVPSLIVTGFGKFKDVDSNPSEWLVRQLAAHDAVGDPSQCALAAADAGGSGTGHTYQVLEVSAEYVQRALKRLAERAGPTGHAIWVHFGVDGTASNFKLERQGFNEADFRVPDEAEWQPHHVPIDPAHSLHHRLRSDLPLDELAGALAEHNVRVNYDAGRFVCNYTLYQSLRQCQQQQLPPSHTPSERGRWQAVFVHVPSFAVIPPEQQLAFATDLLQLLALQPSAQALSDDVDCRATTQGSVQQMFGWLQQRKVPAMFAFLATWFTLKTK